jgi:hypothetical protein
MGLSGVRASEYSELLMLRDISETVPLCGQQVIDER